MSDEPQPPVDPKPQTATTGVKDVQTHVWLLMCFLVLLVAYYIRPDPVTVDLVKAFSGALLLSLRTGSDQRPK